MARMEMVAGDGRTVMVQEEDMAAFEKRGYRLLGPFPYAPEPKTAGEPAPAKKPTNRKD